MLPAPPVVFVWVVVYLTAVLLTRGRLVERLRVLGKAQARPTEVCAKELCQLWSLFVADDTKHIHWFVTQSVSGYLLQHSFELGVL